MLQRCIISILVVSILSLNTYALEYGLEFRSGSSLSVGANLRINDLYELKPSLSLFIGNDNSSFGIAASNNFYLQEMGSLQHYLGFDVGFDHVDTQFPNVDDQSFFIAPHYGLRYDINDVVSIFGEVGLLTAFDPAIFTTMTSALGITFYFPESGVKFF